LLKITGTGNNDRFDANVDDIVPELKNLHELKILELNDLAGLTGKNIEQLPATLEGLSIEKNKRITTNKISELAALRNLKRLNLSGTFVSNATLAKLTRIGGLEELQLNDCPIGNEAMDSIAKFNKLQRLEIQKTTVDLDGLIKLAALDQLREVNVKDSQVQPGDAMIFEKKKRTFCTVWPHIRSQFSKFREQRDPEFSQW
jgi:hypothetical protein